MGALLPVSSQAFLKEVRDFTAIVGACHWILGACLLMLALYKGVLPLSTAVLALGATALALVRDVSGEVLSLHHLSTLVGALDIFERAVSHEVDAYFRDLILPGTAPVFIGAVHFELLNGALDLLVSEHGEGTGIGAFGIWASGYSLRGSLGLFLNARVAEK